MPSARYPYDPDYAVSPGEILAERLEVQGMTPSDLAHRCEISLAQIEAVLAAEQAIEPELARRLEAALDVDARIWLELEAQWRRRGPSPRPAPEAASAGEPSQSGPRR